jgi:hypothetical protein
VDANPCIQGRFFSPTNGPLDTPKDEPYAIGVT